MGKQSFRFGNLDGVQHDACSNITIHHPDFAIITFTRPIGICAVIPADQTEMCCTLSGPSTQLNMKESDRAGRNDLGCKTNPGAPRFSFFKKLNIRGAELIKGSLPFGHTGRPCLYPHPTLPQVSFFAYRFCSCQCVRLGPVLSHG